MMWDRPGTMDRWVEREAANLNAGLVTKKKSLRTLLEERVPSCTGRDGTTWSLDRGVLDRLAALCSEAETEGLQLPIAVHVLSDVGDACYVSDALGAAVLRRAEAFGAAFPYRDGRMYLPLSLAIDLISRYKGALQQVFL